MKNLFILAVILLSANLVSAQFVYTIKADSVKITNHCDTAELILENHTQNVLGFLYNKGRGRTEFRKINKLNDSTLIFGDDTTVIHGSGWRLTGNSGTNPSVNYIGTKDSVDWVVRTFGVERMRILARGHVGIGNNVGASSSLQSTRVFMAQADTISTSVGAMRHTHVSRTNTGTNNMTIGFNHNNNALFTSYIRLDTNTTFIGDYQSGTILGTFSSGGFLNKTNVPVQTVTAATTATNGIAIDATKFLIQGGDTKYINGFATGKRFITEVNSYGTTQHYSDLVLGVTIRKTPGGSSYVFTNKYGLYIVPVRDGANVTNGYSIYSEGTQDTAYLAGYTRLGSTLTTSGAREAVRMATSGVTLNEKDENVFCDATGAAFNVTLPTAVGRTGQKYTVKKTDASANAVTVNTTSAQTIDGNASFALSAQWKLVTLVSNGSNWLIVAQN